MALSGCMNLAPSYSTPPSPVPATVGADAPAAPAQPTALALEQAQAIGWVQTPALQQVLALALAHNRDLKIALANIDKARAQYGMQRADALPTVAASGQASRNRTADDLGSAGRAQTSS
ncbi:MAG: TolC family protein, partial [Simplicispira sp.]|nr:TolC family protein [Simplicispira sp.]